MDVSASVFGEQSRLEPMSADRKARWRKEIDWLLCVTDYIVEFVPSQQKSKDGTQMEVKNGNFLFISLSLIRFNEFMMCYDSKDYGDKATNGSSHEHTRTSQA